MEKNDARECTRSPVQYSSLLHVALDLVDDVCVGTMRVVEPGSVQKVYEMPRDLEIMRRDTSCS
jgi:hypothetical protein